MNAINPQADFAVRLEKPVPGFHDEYEYTFEIIGGERRLVESRWRGPLYPRLPELDKFRRLANSAKGATAEDDRAYGRAVGDAFRRLNGAGKRKGLSLACTVETTAKCRARQIAELHASVEADRRRRTDGEIIAAYEAAMKEKRARQTGVDRRTTLEKRTAPIPPAAIQICAARHIDYAARQTMQAIAVAPAMAPPANRNQAMQITLSQGERARAWRESAGFTRAKLAARSGFSASQIQDYEEGARRGQIGAKAEISEAAWLRYRLACAAIAGQGEAFAWR